MTGAAPRSEGHTAADRSDWLAGAIGFLAIASFYAGASDVLSRTIQLLVVALVALFTVRAVGAPRNLQGIGAIRSAALVLLASALAWFSFATLLALQDRNLDFRDWGVFVVQVALPLMLILFTPDDRIVRGVGRAAVIFGLLDALVNLLGAAGILDTRVPVRRIGGEVHYAYAGLSGSTLATGFVAFVGILYLASLLRRGGALRWLSIPLILLLLTSLQLSSARRYLGLAVVGLLLFAGWKLIQRIGLPFVSLGVASLFMFLTFAAEADDPGNVLRGLLLLNGLEVAGEHPLVGRGPKYFDISDANATFAELSEAGVTESQLLDFSISYGILPTVIYLVAIFLALFTVRSNQPPLAPILVTCMSAELFFGGALASFAGSILFYGALAGLLVAGAVPRPVRAAEGRPA